MKILMTLCLYFIRSTFENNDDGDGNNTNNKNDNNEGHDGAFVGL